MVIIGYSGHAYVCIDIAQLQGISVKGYCDKSELDNNPYNLEYLGSETDLIEGQEYFVGIGDNQLREKISINIGRKLGMALTLIHPKSIIANNAELGQGVLIAAGCVINSFTDIGEGVICNTNAVIEHECIIGSFAHIAPGAVLAGNVSVGNRTFVGANSVVKQGVTIGADVVIGAGTVVLKDVPDGAKIVGNPGRQI